MTWTTCRCETARALWSSPVVALTLQLLSNPLKAFNHTKLLAGADGYSGERPEGYRVLRDP